MIKFRNTTLKILTFGFYRRNGKGQDCILPANATPTHAYEMLKKTQKMDIHESVKVQEWASGIICKSEDNDVVGTSKPLRVEAYKLLTYAPAQISVAEKMTPEEAREALKYSDPCRSPKALEILAGKIIGGGAIHIEKGTEALIDKIVTVVDTREAGYVDLPPSPYKKP